MKTTPLEHQAKILPIIDSTDNYGLFWEMGLGKTWVGCYFIQKAAGKCLILCPNSVCDTWYQEIITHTFVDHSDVCILSGTGAQRRKLLQEPYSIYILNYEGLRVVELELLKIEWDIIISDESHRIKNPKALQTKIACKLKGKRKFIFSGTPLLNSYMDVFSQMLFMDNGKTFGKNFFAFRNQYFIDHNGGRFRGNFPDWQLRRGAEKIIMEKMSKNCHRLEKKDCLNLPEKMYETRYCYATPEIIKHYSEMKKDCITFINDQAVTAQVALTKILRLNQITSGFLKTVEGVETDFQSNPKMDILKEVVDEITQNPNNKVIVWAHFRKDIETIAKTFAHLNPVVIYGGVEDRGSLVNSFQTSPQVRMFVGQPHSAGIGITLSAANYAIYYSYNFSLEDRLQSEDRCHRKGSEIHKSITYIDLVMKDTIDEVILKALKSKNDMAESVMEYIKSGAGKPVVHQPAPLDSR